ncbi:MAG: hypothetical protein IJ712_06140, partial [Anaerovibrio sp.]|nr:hypothetical protein [Anaerovibrio sp.]
MSDNFDKTQPIPRVTDDMADQKTQLINYNQVRRLEPINVNQRQQLNNGADHHQQTPPPRPPKKSGKGKLAFTLVLAFVVALLAGLFISGYMSEQTSRETQLKTQQELSDREARNAEGKQNDLSSKKKQLDQRIKDLEAQQ